jgi:hypothetical protein
MTTPVDVGSSRAGQAHPPPLSSTYLRTLIPIVLQPHPVIVNHERTEQPRRHIGVVFDRHNRSTGHLERFALMFCLGLSVFDLQLQAT